MKYKTAKDIIAVAESRGFKIGVNPGPPPMPYLILAGLPASKKEDATDALMNALRAWRLEIIEELKAGAPQ